MCRHGFWPGLDPEPGNAALAERWGQSQADIGWKPVKSPVWLNIITSQGGKWSHDDFASFHTEYIKIIVEPLP
jgi:hypothetical protein